ncbi:MAG: insulinase family protein [Fimbriimonadaceae bacterium]|nr:insulinase family protein [Fimbriimonadaceae bacterium]
MSNIQKIVLDNGVRILVEPVTHVQSAAIGLWCRTGSRHELDTEEGITHLIEHMLFKGTPTRTAKEIAESIEGRGGMLNAFTDKESTCYYCRTLSDDAVNGIEVLTDMMLHSNFDPEELEREEEVVCEEIKRSVDEPGDHVHELHLEYRWGRHALGKPIIGTEESVRSFRRDHILSYMDRRYRAENVMLSVSGNVDPDQIRAAAETTLGKLPSGVTNSQVERPLGTKAMNEVSKDTEQVHFCIGTDGISMYDEVDIPVMSILDSALGGSMSSRLFQEVRERRGLVYSIGSYTLTYGAGGAYTVYGGTSKKNWEEVKEITRREMNKVMQEGLSEAELERVKRSLAGNLVLALEGMNSRMMRMSRNEFNYERQITVEEALERLNKVTNSQVMELANSILTEERVSTTAIGPF